MLICGSALAKAGPFLCSGPIATGSATLTPVSYVITGLGASPITTPALVTGANAALHYDLGALTPGSYTVTVVAVNAGGLPGPASGPFTFSTVTPAAPTSLSVSPN